MSRVESWLAISIVLSMTIGVILLVAGAAHDLLSTRPRRIGIVAIMAGLGLLGWGAIGYAFAVILDILGMWA